jgi:hypothetical protein
LTVHTSANDPGGTFSGGLEVDGGLILKNGAMVDVAHGNTTLLGTQNNFQDSALTTRLLSLDGALTANNSLLNTQVAIIGDKTVNGNMGLTDGTWNTFLLTLGQDGSKGNLVVDSSTITLTNVNVGGVSGSGGIVVGANGEGGLIIDKGSIMKSQGAPLISIGNGLMTVEGQSNVTVPAVLVGFGSTNSKLSVEHNGSTLNLGGIPGGGMSVLAGSVIVRDQGD